MGSLIACGNTVTTITSCPPESAQILLFNMPIGAYPSGMALISVSNFRCCLINQMFGAGSLTIKGSDLVGGFYYNDRFVGNLQVFAWNIPNYLIREGQNNLNPSMGQWRYVVDSGGIVIGIEIYGIGYGNDDLFTISPIASCSSMSVVQTGFGLQFERAIFSGDGLTTQYSIAHGLSGVPNFSVQPVGQDAAGEYTIEADATNIIITYNVAPPIGTNNIIFDWAANL